MDVPPATVTAMPNSGFFEAASLRLAGVAHELYEPHIADDGCVVAQHANVGRGDGGLSEIVSTALEIESVKRHPFDQVATGSKAVSVGSHSSS